MAYHLRRLVSDTKAILITYLPIRVPTGSRVTELPDSGGSNIQFSCREGNRTPTDGLWAH